MWEDTFWETFTLAYLVLFLLYHYDFVFILYYFVILCFCMRDMCTYVKNLILYFVSIPYIVILFMWFYMHIKLGINIWYQSMVDPRPKRETSIVKSFPMHVCVVIMRNCVILPSVRPDRPNIYVYGMRFHG